MELLQQPGGAKREDSESLTGGEVAEGASEPGFADACGSSEEDVAPGGDPARVGKLQEDLFLEAPGVPVVDVLDAGVWLTESGFFEQTGEAAVVAVGFFVLDEESDECLVGEVGVGGDFNPSVEPLGHAKELEVVEGGQRLFEHHG